MNDQILKTASTLIKFVSKKYSVRVNHKTIVKNGIRINVSKNQTTPYGTKVFANYIKKHTAIWTDDLENFMHDNLRKDLALERYSLFMNEITLGLSQLGFSKIGYVTQIPAPCCSQNPGGRYEFDFENINSIDFLKEEKGDWTLGYSPPVGASDRLNSTIYCFML